MPWVMRGTIERFHEMANGKRLKANGMREKLWEKADLKN
jgi:hypothetical protein